jgi:hypothetical protein
MLLLGVVLAVAWVAVVAWLVNLGNDFRKLRKETQARLKEFETEVRRLNQRTTVTQVRLQNEPDDAAARIWSETYETAQDPWQPTRVRRLEQDVRALVDSLGLKRTLTEAVPSRIVFVPKKEAARAKSS